MQFYKVIGVMSGTSLDGVDLALCSFRKENNKWEFHVDAAETISYSDKWRDTLSSLHSGSAEKFARKHVQYGGFLGKLVNDFLKKHKATPDFVASHGHTIFHQPKKGFTVQVGEGAALSVECGLPVVCDFRTVDVALGGQGAPLVPIGDKLLFGNYTYCLNLGGIANISSPGIRFSNKKNKNSVQAFDVCPCNMVLNYLVNKQGKEYDENGKLADSGKINKQLLKQLNGLSYYKKKTPKSLGREDVERDFILLLDSSEIPVKDKMSTFCEHIALMIAESINGSPHSNKKEKLLITGGGAYNKHLVKRIKAHSKAEVIIPDKTIIEFKEAIIFAFLGVLRWTGEVNCLKSVTGAERDSVGGAIYLS